MIVFLDVNVILDFLLGFRSNGIEAAQVMTLVRDERVTVYTAVNTFVMAFYHLRKAPYAVSAKDTKHTLAVLRQIVKCVPVDEADLDKALALEKPEDLEDGFQLMQAIKINADVIVTNDRRAFRKAPMRVVSTKKFLIEWEF